MRRLIALFITVLLVSCSSDGDSFKINGVAEGFDDGTQVFLYSIGGNNQPSVIDTLTINNGKFAGTYSKSDEITVNYMNVGRINANILYFPENEDLDVTIYRDSINASFVTGSKQNETYTDLTRTVRGLTAKRQKMEADRRTAQVEQDDLLVRELQAEMQTLIAQESAYKKQFVLDNSNSLYAAMLMSELISRKELSAAEANEAIKNFSPKVAATKVASDLKTLVSTLTQAEIGAIAPDFSAPTPTGEMLSLKETLGEYTIIDFWASWCRPCRAENPNVVRVYNKYHDKGLNIISVSLDRTGQKERWLKAIEDDKMDWYHVSNLKFWSDPIAKMYNVKAIPATFLLDKDGKIIDKNLRGPALESRMAGLLGGQ